MSVSLYYCRYTNITYGEKAAAQQQHNDIELSLKVTESGYKSVKKFYFILRKLRISI